MTHRPARLVAVLLVGAALALPSTSARADSPTDYGYWTKAQTPTSPNPLIPVPPTVPAPPPEQVVPEGGLFVALATNTSQPNPEQVPSPVEPAAVSALRFFVEPGSPAILSLTVADGQDVDGPKEQNHPPFVVDACVVDFREPQWDTPEGAGRWSDKPVWDCESTSTPSIVEEDGTRMTWDLGSAFEVFEGQIDVVLVPKGIQDPQNPSVVQPTPFQIGFKPPDEQTLTVEDFGGGDDEEVSDEDLDFSLDDLEGDLFGEFALGEDALDLDGVIAGADNGGGAGTDGGRQRRPIRPIARAPIPLDSRGDRILAVSLLFLIVGGLWWVGGAPMRPPRLLGSLGGGATAATTGGPTTGGVGRFSRPRLGRPPRL